MAAPTYWSARTPAKIVAVTGANWQSNLINIFLEDGNYGQGSYITNGNLTLAFDWPLPPEATNPYCEIWIKCYCPSAGKTVQTQARLGGLTFPSDRAPTTMGTTSPGTWIGFAITGMTAAQVVRPGHGY